MFNVIHPNADSAVEYGSFDQAERELRALEYTTRIPGYVKPVEAPIPPMVEAPVSRKWFWQR